MTSCLCPLCGAPECLVEEDRMRPDVVRYWCQPHCDTFRMVRVFVKHVWSSVTEENKRALAASLQATKGPQRAAPLIQGNNYRAYITHGRRLQQRGANEPPAGTT